MFKTILWATDGSETAAQALPYVLELTENTGAKLVIAYSFIGVIAGEFVLSGAGVGETGVV